MINPRTDADHAETLAQWEAAGRNAEAAARALGISGTTFKSRLIRARGMQLVRVTTARDADDNVTGTHTVERPDKGECVAEQLPGFAVSRRTVHRMGGEVVQTWEQEKPEGRSVALAIEAAAAALSADLPRASPVPAPLLTNALLCNVYNVDKI